MQPKHNRRGLLLASLAAGALAAALLALGTGLGGPLSIRCDLPDAGPRQGFRVSRARGATGRWSRASALVDLPVRVSGPARLELTAGRPGQGAAWIEVRQGERLLARFLAQEAAGRYGFALQPGGSGEVWLSAPDAPARFGLRLERIVIVPSRSFALLPRVRLLGAAALGCALLCAGLTLAGLPPRRAAIASLALLPVPAAACGVFDTASALHLTAKTALPVGAISLAAAPLIARRWGRTSALLFAFALCLRALLLFHPAYHFWDVDIHLGLAQVVAEHGPFEAWSRIDHYQRLFDLGRASVAGRFRPLPYPPAFHTLAGLLAWNDTADTMKWLAVLAQALCVVLVTALGGRLLPDKPSRTGAGVLAALFPGDLLELLRASFPAILGHLADLTLVAAILWGWSSLSRWRGMLALGLGLSACALTYNASPVHFALFLPSLLAAASLRPATTGRIGLAVGGLLGAALALGFYGRYLWDVLANVVVRTAREPGGGVLDRAAAIVGDWRAVGPFGPLALVGIVLVVRELWPRVEARLVLAWAAYVPAVTVVAVALTESFYYFRRLYFVQPLLVLSTARLTSGRRPLARLLLLALIVWCLYTASALREPFFQTHSGRVAGL